MVTMKRDQLMIEQYSRIRSAQSDQIEVEMPGYLLVIEGNNLMMQALTKDEILLKGLIHCVRVEDYA